MDASRYMDEHDSYKAEVERLRIENDLLRKERDQYHSALLQIRQTAISVPETTQDDPYLTVRQFAEKYEHSLTQGELSFLSQISKEHCNVNKIQIKFDNIDSRHNARPSFPLSVIRLCYQQHYEDKQQPKSKQSTAK